MRHGHILYSINKANKNTRIQTRKAGNDISRRHGSNSVNIVKFFLDGLGNWYANKTLITEAIVLADKLGFDGTLMPDHYMWGDRQSRSKRPDDYSTLETWTTLTYLAGKTERIRLGTLVTPIPFRPPGCSQKCSQRWTFFRGAG